MLLELGASHAYAVEPSQASEVWTVNTKESRDRVSCLNSPGEEIPHIPIDLAFSFGMLPHIPDPQPIVRRVYQVLPRGGKFIVWLYDYEGNESYLALFNPIHKLTAILPDFFGFFGKYLERLYGHLYPAVQIFPPSYETIYSPCFLKNGLAQPQINYLRPVESHICKILSQAGG